MCEAGTLPKGITCLLKIHLYRFGGTGKNNLNSPIIALYFNVPHLVFCLRIGHSVFCLKVPETLTVAP